MIKLKFMKKAILQIWEESLSDDNVIPDGASLHLDINLRNDYVDSLYKYRGDIHVPESYLRITGQYEEVMISEAIYNKLEISRTIVLKENEFNNLIQFKEIV